jgi:hypothetical protein
MEFLSRPLDVTINFIGNKRDRGYHRKASEKNPGCRKFYRVNYVLCCKEQK